MTTQYLIFGILILLVIGLAVWLFLMSKRLKMFFKGKNAADLEVYINGLAERVNNLEKEKEALLQNVKALQEKMTQTVRGVETLRFNPFKDVGGNQSFAVALLDESGDGVVLSSLYGREKMSFFAKPVKKLKSEFE